MRRVRHTREQRVEILEQARSGERSVGEIAQEEGNRPPSDAVVTPRNQP